MEAVCYGWEEELIFAEPLMVLLPVASFCPDWTEDCVELSELSEVQIAS